MNVKQCNINSVIIRKKKNAWRTIISYVLKENRNKKDLKIIKYKIKTIIRTIVLFFILILVAWLGVARA